MTGRFNLLDLFVLLLYLSGTTALGMWIGRSQKSANEYFVAERAIPWWAVNRNQSWCGGCVEHAHGR